MFRFILFIMFVIIIIFVTAYFIVPFAYRKYVWYKEKQKQEELKKQKGEENEKPIGFTISK